MKLLNQKSLISLFAELGKFIEKEINGELGDTKIGAKVKNPWFVTEYVDLALLNWSKSLSEEQLNEWLSIYSFNKNPKKVAIVMAGNIPLVGFHDFLSVVLSGNIAMVKLATDDAVLFKKLVSYLIELEPIFQNHFQLVEKLEKFDAVIATGSDNTSNYFEYYFKKYPHVIRKNRTSIAILSGNETKDELALLAKDIFTYFGMGCRNVTMIYAPEGFDITTFIDACAGFTWIKDHNKYFNNYEYHKAILLLNREQHLDNGFALFQERPDLHSPLSRINYSFYSPDKGKTPWTNYVDQNKIQCIVGNLFDESIPYGGSQIPSLSDYADGVDTMKFLNSLS